MKNKALRQSSGWTEAQAEFRSLMRQIDEVLRRCVPREVHELIHEEPSLIILYLSLLSNKIADKKTREKLRELRNRLRRIARQVRME